MFSKRVENTVGKGEIVSYEQFLHWPHCFKKDLYSRHAKTRACLGKGRLSKIPLVCWSCQVKLIAVRESP